MQSNQFAKYLLFQWQFSHDFIKKSILEGYSFRFQLMEHKILQNLNLSEEPVLKIQNLKVLKFLNHRQKYLMFLCLDGQFYFDGIKTMPSKVEKCMIWLHFHFKPQILSKSWIRKPPERISWTRDILFK